MSQILSTLSILFILFKLFWTPLLKSQILHILFLFLYYYFLVPPPRNCSPSSNHMEAWCLSSTKVFVRTLALVKCLEKALAHYQSKSVYQLNKVYLIINYHTKNHKYFWYWGNGVEGVILKFITIDVPTEPTWIIVMSSYNLRSLREYSRNKIQKCFGRYNIFINRKSHK